MAEKPTTTTVIGGRQVTSRLVDDVFNLESAIESILSSLQNDVEHSVANGNIPSGAGQIDVYIDKKEDKYTLMMKSNGTGLNREELIESISIIGVSSEAIGDGKGMFVLAPFHLNTDNYILSSNRRGSDESLCFKSTIDGFTEIEDESEYDFLGTKIELEIDSVEHTVGQIGSEIRKVSNAHIDVPVVYEVREEGTVRKQKHINFS